MSARLPNRFASLKPANRAELEEIGRDGVSIMNLCGRGDKDVFTVADVLGVSI
jgi:tryptophan synthase beta subunit